MIDGIGNNITDFTSVVMIVPAGSRALALRNSKIDKISFTSSESNGTTAELYGYLPRTFDASMSKPWEQVKTVSVAATTSFRIPLMDDDFAIFSVPGKRVCCCVYLRSKSNATFDESERTPHTIMRREMEWQSVPLGRLLCLLKALSNEHFCLQNGFKISPKTTRMSSPQVYAVS
jgi:hypothetical protein